MGLMLTSASQACKWSKQISSKTPQDIPLQTTSSAATVGRPKPCSDLRNSDRSNIARKDIKGKHPVALNGESSKPKKSNSVEHAASILPHHETAISKKLCAASLCNSREKLIEADAKQVTQPFKLSINRPKA